MILCAWIVHAVPSTNRRLSRSFLEAAVEPAPGAGTKRPDAGVDFRKRFMGFPSELCLSYLFTIRFLILDMSSAPRKCSPKSFDFFVTDRRKYAPRWRFASH